MAGTLIIGYGNTLRCDDALGWRAAEQIAASQTGGDLEVQMHHQLGPELLPLLPAAILYINLATDGLPALALGLSPPDRDVMKRPPRDPSESIFSREVRILVLLGVLIECPIFLWIYFDNQADLEGASDPFNMFSELNGRGRWRPGPGGAAGEAVRSLFVGTSTLSGLTSVAMLCWRAARSKSPAARA